jgi:DNA polymerase III subunit gamma/tau
VESLYRKYRPQVFEDIVGQKTVVKSLQNALNLQRLSHAYVFSGPRGTGKTTTARLFAKGLNCLKSEKPTASPCNQCASCRGIVTGSSPDVLELDAASRTSVEDIREIIESARFQPAISRFRVFILDEAQMLSRSAFNALLKTLEEPPGFVVFILATTEPQKLPPTVLSRCQRFDFARLDEADFESLIRKVAASEGFTIADDQFIPLLYQFSGGAARDGLSLLEQVALYSGNVLSQKALAELLGIPETKLVIQLLDALVNLRANEVLECAAKGYSSGWSFWTFLNVWTSVVRDALALKTGLKPSLVYDEEDRKKLEAIVARASPQMFIDALEKQGDYRFTYKWESEGQLLWDMVFVSLLADFHELRTGRARALPGRRTAEPFAGSEPLPVGASESPKEAPVPSQESQPPASRTTGPSEAGGARRQTETPTRPADAGPIRRSPLDNPLFSSPPPKKRTVEDAGEGASGEAGDKLQGRKAEPQFSPTPTATVPQEGSPATAVLTRNDSEGGDGSRHSPSTASGVAEPVGAEESLQEEPGVMHHDLSIAGRGANAILTSGGEWGIDSQVALPDQWRDFLKWLEDKDLILTIFLAQADRVEISEGQIRMQFPPTAMFGYRELLPPTQRKRIKEMYEAFSGCAIEEVDLTYREEDGEKWREEVLARVRSVFPGSEAQDP